MTQKTVTHVLIAAGGNDATSRIIDELQKDGMPVSAATADDRQELANLLRQAQWEVVICFEDCAISAAVVLDLAAQNAPAIPVILATSADRVPNLLPMLEQGIADVVPVEQSKRLFLSVQREAANCRLKRKLLWVDKNQQTLEEHYCAVLASSTIPTGYIHDGTHLYCNESYASLFGFENIQSAMAVPFLDLIQAQDHALVKTLISQPLQKQEPFAIRVVLRDRSEGRMMLTLTPAQFRQKSCIKVTGQPLTGASTPKLQPVQPAVNDLLSDLPNHAQFTGQLQAAIRTARQNEVFSSLLLVALNERIRIQTDEEKANLNLMINDITSFLKDWFQIPFTAARLDDHVLGLIVANAETDEITALVALIRSIANKYFKATNAGPAVHCCTIGSATINGREQKPEYVLAQASRHLTAAQFDRIQQNILNGRPETVCDTELLEQLMLALTCKQFRLLYQPVVHIKGPNHKGYEVLSRMLIDDGKEILPETFVRVANHNGLGEKLDKLIITLAIDSLEKPTKPQSLIINLTSNTLMSRTFLPWLQKQFEKRKISPDSFAIAISEADIYNNEDRALEFCRSLCANGVKLVISHFGCTLDPYAILAGIKPDLVKLDSALLKDIAKRPTQRTKMQTLITKLRNDGILAVAPQVESLAVLPALWNIGMDYVQGYALQAPSDEMNYNFLVEEEITLSAGRI